jgi:phage gp36-like protein
MVAQYTSVGRIYDIEPAIKDVSDLSSAHLGIFINDAEAEINARLIKSYTMPLSNAPLITAIATDLSIYRVLSRRIFTQAQLKNSVWPDRFKESLDTLKEVADGTIELVDEDGTIIAGRTDQAELWSNTKNYLPTFHEGSIGPGGHFADNILDEDKQDDLLDERDL